MNYELFELEFDNIDSNVKLRAKNMALYLKMHPEELTSALEAFFDVITALRLENHRLITATNPALVHKGQQPVS